MEPEFLEGRVSRANLHLEQGRPDAALVDSRTGLVSDPGDPRLWCLTGLAEQELGAVDRARAAYDQALAVDPSYAMAAVNRAVLSPVPTAVAVVTAIDGTEPCGMTIGSLGSLSREPPLVLFCVAREARSHPALRAADRYCVSVLAHDQSAVARRFADRDPDRF